MIFVHLPKTMEKMLAGASKVRLEGIVGISIAVPILFDPRDGLDAASVEGAQSPHVPALTALQLGTGQQVLERVGPHRRRPLDGVPSSTVPAHTAPNPCQQITHFRKPAQVAACVGAPFAIRFPPGMGQGLIIDPAARFETTERPLDPRQGVEGFGERVTL